MEISRANRSDETTRRNKPTANNCMIESQAYSSNSDSPAKETGQSLAKTDPSTKRTDVDILLRTTTSPTRQQANQPTADQQHGRRLGDYGSERISDNQVVNVHDSFGCSLAKCHCRNRQVGEGSGGAHARICFERRVYPERHFITGDC